MLGGSSGLGLCVGWVEWVGFMSWVGQVGWVYGQSLRIFRLLMFMPPYMCPLLCMSPDFLDL